MTAVRVAVTAEHIAEAGPWPHSPAGDDAPLPRPGWKNPVELALAERSGVEVDVDGDSDGTWHATIGLANSSTLVVDLPDAANERLEFSWAHGVEMEPFEFSIELDDWLVGMVHEALAG